MAISFQRLVLNFFKRFDYEEIEGLRDSVKSVTSARERSIQKEVDALTPGDFEDEFDVQGYVSHLEASFEFLGEVSELTDELCILALHKKLEITIRKLIGKFYPALKKSELHKIDYLKKELSFDITTLPCYASADELRLINNAIKHEGVVSKALSKYPGWHEGEQLKGCGAAFVRLAPGIETYVGEFCEAVRKDLKL